MNKIYKIIFCTIFLILQYSNSFAEINITTDEGIEVFQDEKYYLLKKNVEIVTDDYLLTADNVKANFEKDLYDIKHIFAKGNSLLKSDSRNITAKGPELEFNIKEQILKISGINSSLELDFASMYSDGKIDVYNNTGSFSLKGEKSKIIGNDIEVIGSDIKGKFSNTSNTNEIIELNVIDENISYVKTESLEMYAQKIFYNKEQDYVELFDNVKVIRDTETITGDYGKINMQNQSYKISSKDKSKVKVSLSNNDDE